MKDQPTLTLVGKHPSTHIVKGKQNLDTSPLSSTPKSSTRGLGPITNLISISKEIEFDAGHRVPNHKSKCRNPHGHRYRVVAVITGETVTESGASDEGMVLDFGDLKSILVEHVHDPLDHGFIVWKDDKQLWGVFEDSNSWIYDWKIIKFPYIPTAENMAIWCWNQLEGPLYNNFRGNFVLTEVHVYETPTSCAAYYGPEFGVEDE